jgi:dTDP-4-dehydrorhamnose 3,5-epimerase
VEIRVIPTKLEGVLLVETSFFRDERGFFLESYSQRRYAAAGIDVTFVQDNHSRSAQGVLRGLHYQDRRAPMGKLIRCTQGSVFDVAVDLRVGSPTFGEWVGVELSAEQMNQVYIPPGFGHGFAALSPVADLQYKCTAYYAPETEGCIAWNDPDIAIRWPVSAPTLSKRDQQGMSLRAYRENPAFD